MPFRIPDDYNDLSLCDSDPSEDELIAYIKWLQSEQVAAATVLAAMRKPPAGDLPDALPDGD